MFNTKRVKEYLNGPSVNEMVYINDQETISFHWSNHRVTKKMARLNILDSYTLDNEVLFIESNDSMISFSKLDILNLIVTKPGDLTEFLFEPKKVFRDLTSSEYQEIELINLVTKDDIDYAYRSMLLKNKIPQRGLRLNSNQEILICFSGNFIKETKAIIHQFSHTGILFKSCNLNFLEDFEANENFKFYIDSKKFINGGQAYSESENDSFILNKKSFQFASSLNNNSSEIFFFIRYIDIKNQKLKIDFSNYLSHFEEKFTKNIS